jgi:hypothetical protein
MNEKNKSAGSISRTDDSAKGMLREGAHETSGRTRLGDLLRKSKSKVEDVFSKNAKEGWVRHFVKGYGYRIYTGLWVTPIVTLGTLALRSHYHLNNIETVYVQSGVEFVVKPFTYALFEWGAAHIKPGYINNGNTVKAMNAAK